jgi:D-alanyl-lipoteichoic acid acyltransferase DltB (MBOAT superfamily)
MYLTVNQTSLGYSYADGIIPDEKLSPERRERKINNMPTFFELLSFLFYFGHCLIGPAAEFKPYLDFIHRREHFKHIPSNFIPAFKRFLTALCKLFIKNQM